MSATAFTATTLATLLLAPLLSGFVVWKWSNSRFSQYYMNKSCLIYIFLLFIILILSITFLRNNVYVIGLDESVSVALSWAHGTSIVYIVVWITRLGDSAALTAVVVTAASIFAATGRRKAALGLVVSFAAALATVWSIKFVVNEARPDLFTPFDTVLSPSFPSAHAAVSLAVYVPIALSTSYAASSRQIGFIAGLASSFAVGLIALSRLVLSVHTVPDVVAGIIIGVSSSILGILIAKPSAEERRFVG